MSDSLANVDYVSLDSAKNAFIAASRRTMLFAEEYGFIPDERLGASANLFSFNLTPYFTRGAQQLFVSLLPEGLGTADDARPDDLSPEELRSFWGNIAYKTLSCLTNDAASSGLQTVLVSLYLPSSTPKSVFDPSFLNGFLNSFVEGCQRIGCVYFSGETPQLEGKIIEDRLDIAGALWAVAPAGIEPVDGRKLGPGQTIVLVESSGPHENGFTVLRKLAQKLPEGYRTKLPSGAEYWEAINRPSHLYTPLIQRALRSGVRVTAIENITGHGWQKVMRSSLPLSYVIERMLPMPEIFSFVEERAQKSRLDMLQTFNCGAGVAIFTETESDGEACVQIARELGLNATVAGHTETAASREVVIAEEGLVLRSEGFALSRG